MTAGASQERAMHQKVGWFELFYDLVIVAAVGYAAHAFAHESTWAFGFWIAAWALGMFVLWLFTSLANNVFPGDFRARRLLGLVQMLALVVAALGTVADTGLSNAMGFAGLSVTFATVAGIYALALRGVQDERRRMALLGWAALIGAVVLALGLALPDDAEWTLTGAPTWIIAIGLGVPTLALLGAGVRRFAPLIDDEHLSERLGQLVIIVLGESFVSLISALSGLSSIPNPVFFVLTFAVVFAIWTLYFSSVLPTGVPRASGPLRAWLLTHWLLMFGAIGTAAGFSAVTLVGFGEQTAHHAGHWTTVPLMFVMGSIAALTWIGAGRVTPLVWLHLGVTGVLFVLALMSLTLSIGGENWELAIGSLVVIADAFVASGWVRPYRDRD